MIYQLSFYVPESDKEIVKSAIFAAGAGCYDNYDCCAWETVGTGQFRPLEGSNPTIGEHHKIEQVVEVKIETICQAGDVDTVIAALKSTHPYETPAYNLVACQQ